MTIVLTAFGLACTFVLLAAATVSFANEQRRIRANKQTPHQMWLEKNHSHTPEPDPQEYR